MPTDVKPKHARPKHSRCIRWTHWINFPLLTLMIWSGLLIYWANDQYQPFFPEWFYKAFGISQRLSEGMWIHFFLAWLFTLNGIAYVGYLIFSGEWRDMLPAWPPNRALKDAFQVVLHDLGIRKETLPKTKFNGAQKIAYSAITVMGMLAVATGLAIYKPTQLRYLTALFGGYEGARLIHFILTLSFVAFFGVHVGQVVKTGWKNARAMITGFEQDPRPRMLRRALAVGLTAAIIGIGTFTLMANAPKVGATPSPFRRVLEFNGRLWTALFSPARLTETPRVLASLAQARVNGDLGLEDPIDPKTWRMKVMSGPEATPQTFTLAAIQALPRTETTTVFKCVEGWSQEIAYAGVKFSDFVHYLSIDPKTHPFISLETPNGAYYVSIDAASMMHPQTLLAYEMNGEPLSPEQGAPLRLIIPVKYGIKSLKRIGTLKFTFERGPDYWAEQGYDWFAGL